jgi:divalent metal cation (Fe/Co/Zn/Cd) transporter
VRAPGNLTITTNPDREALVRRGLALNYLTIAYNTMEAVVSVGAGVVSGSVALVGFGIDSAIEVASAAAAQWRLRRDLDANRRQRVEVLTHRIIGWSFLVLALYVTADSVQSLLAREEPDKSVIGLAILVLSIAIMPLLARAKRRVAIAMDSRSLKADAKQTSLCAYLSAIALAGVGLNAILDWWWADPVCALVMVPIIAKEGFEGVARL